MVKKYICITLAIMLSAGCDESRRGACSEQLQAISSDPVNLAERAVARGDRRFLAVDGYNRQTPGVLDRDVRERHGYRTLEKTSDTPADDSCEQYQESAIEYAERYNRRAIELVMSNSQ